MSDIVERLREGRTDGTALRWAVTDIHREAADEIERLRAEVERLKKRVSWQRDQTVRAYAEVIACHQQAGLNAVAFLLRDFEP